MTKPYKDCYVQLNMDLKVSEMFDADGKFIFIGKVHREAVLHAAQANNPNKKHLIKKMMWEELLEEKKWQMPDKANFLDMCNFTEVRIPRYDKPITYNI